MSFTLIYIRTDKWLISKEHVEREAWNAKLYWFLTSLSYESSEALAEFLKSDFHLSEESKNYIIGSLESEAKTYELQISKDKKVSLKKLQMDLLKSKGELIDWEEWSYCFSKVTDQFHLWVYVGGIADICREINLSTDQIKQWEEAGNSFIKELALDLQHLNSEIYSEAIEEGRKLL